MIFQLKIIKKGVKNMGYKRVARCKTCGKIYSYDVPEICKKCGTLIAIESKDGEYVRDDGERIVAKWTLTGWKVLNK